MHKLFIYCFYKEDMISKQHSKKYEKEQIGMYQNSIISTGIDQNKLCEKTVTTKGKNWYHE